MTDPLHNQPPAFDGEAFDSLRALVDDFNDAAKEYLQAGEIATAAEAERLADLIKGARELQKKIDAQRAKDKAPWAERAKIVDSKFRTLKEAVEAIRDKVTPLQTAWLRKEQAKADAKRREAEERARKEREEAERKMREAEAQLDPAAMAEAEAEMKKAEKESKAAAKQSRAKVGSHTGGGRGMSLRKVRSAKVTHPVKLAVFLKDEPDFLEALEKLANRRVRAAGFSGALPGCEIVEEEVAV